MGSITVAGAYFLIPAPRVRWKDVGFYPVATGIPEYMHLSMRNGSPVPLYISRIVWVRKDGVEVALSDELGMDLTPYVFHGDEHFIGLKHHVWCMEPSTKIGLGIVEPHPPTPGWPKNVRDEMRKHGVKIRVEYYLFDKRRKPDLWYNVLLRKDFPLVDNSRH